MTVKVIVTSQDKQAKQGMPQEPPFGMKQAAIDLSTVATAVIRKFT
jgi:hypothetical protein